MMPKVSRIVAGAVAGFAAAYAIRPVPSLQQGTLLLGGIIVIGEIAMDFIEPYVPKSLGG